MCVWGGGSSSAGRQQTLRGGASAGWLTEDVFFRVRHLVMGSAAHCEGGEGGSSSRVFQLLAAGAVRACFKGWQLAGDSACSQ